MNSPARDFLLRYAHESAMYAWSYEQQKVVLIAGHTHRPVFQIGVPGRGDPQSP